MKSKKILHFKKLNYNFFDFLALPLWLFIIINALYSLDGGNWTVYTRLGIGIVGFVTDSIFAFIQPFG